MNPAIEKLERRLAALDRRIDEALEDPVNLPQDWEMLVMRAGDLVDKIVDMRRAARERERQPTRKAA